VGKVKILVVEDEIIIADNICDTLNDLGYETLEPAINYSEAVETIEREIPDIAILDIQISGRKSGIDLAKKINKYFNFPFIYLTSNSDSLTFNEAKQTNPSAFLAKPFSKEDLFLAVEVAIHNFSVRNKQNINDSAIINEALFFKEKGVFKKKYFVDILFIKSDHVYVDIFFKNGTCQVVRIGLSEIMNKLNSSFVRVQRGYIINLNEITQIESKVVRIGEHRIPIGKTYKDALLKHVNTV